MLKKLRGNRKGFTLVELIVVIVVLGVLAVIAIPRYNDYVKDARLAHIKSDMTTASKLVEVYAMEGEEGISKYKGSEASPDDIANLNTAIDEGRAFREGELLVPSDSIGGEFHLIKENFMSKDVGSKLKGSFLVGRDDNIYYISDKVVGENTDSGENENNNNQVPEDIYVAKDEDFKWVSNDNGYTATNKAGKGYYEYIRTDKEVEIPHIINGHPMTNYYRMFYESPVEKVVSTNKNVTSMSYMFQFSSATNLDLSSFDTSNVTDMSGMFWSSKAAKLDLSSFNTNNVTNMYGMFWSSKATKLDLSLFDTSNVTGMYGMFKSSSAKSLNLSSFDTSNVTNMSSMFDSSEATSLNLSSFDTSNVTNMSSMFWSSSATSLDLSSFDISSVTNMKDIFARSSATTGYARTQADADKFNSGPLKPSDLTFVVK